MRVCVCECVRTCVYVCVRLCVCMRVRSWRRGADAVGSGTARAVLWVLFVCVLCLCEYVGMCVRV